MKTIALLSLLVFTSPFILAGQTDRPFNRIKDLKHDTIIIKPFLKDPAFENPIFKFHKQDDGIIAPDSDLIEKNFRIESPGVKNYYDILSEEKFPGSGRYYAKRHYLVNPYEKSFIKKPGTTAKYYLIIKDPISNKRVN
jgi:hypothetical protein